jgi:Rrf2 family protein
MNLQLTNQADYAVRSMAFLAWNQQGKWIPSNVIAEEMQISRMFLSRINMLLAKAGLILTQHGARGGVMLAKPASEISIYEIVSAIEGPVQVNKFLGNDEEYTFPLSEQLEKYWQTTQDFLVNKLKETSLADLIEV